MSYAKKYGEGKSVPEYIPTIGMMKCDICKEPAPELVFVETTHKILGYFMIVICSSCAKKAKQRRKMLNAGLN